MILGLSESQDAIIIHILFSDYYLIYLCFNRPIFSKHQNIGTVFLPTVASLTNLPPPFLILHRSKPSKPPSRCCFTHNLSSGYYYWLVAFCFIYIGCLCPIVRGWRGSGDMEGTPAGAGPSSFIQSLQLMRFAPVTVLLSNPQIASP